MARADAARRPFTFPRSFAFLSALALTGALAGFAQAEDEADTKADTTAESEPAKWSVTDPGIPSRVVEFEATEGTWMSVDVNPVDQRLAFDLVGDIYTLPIEGGDATLIAGGLSYDLQPRWSADGKHLLFTSDRGGGDNIWMMGADGSEPRQLTKEDFRLLNNAVWHPSGTYFVAKKHFTSGRSLGAGEMWMYHLAHPGKGVQLTKRKNDQQDAGEPEISPDGRYLYWSEDMSGGSTFQYNKDPNDVIYVIRRMDLTTGETIDLIRRPGGAITPRISPDGGTLAFIRRKREKSVLALYDIETGVVRDLWDGLSLDQQETWAIFGPYAGYAWVPGGDSLVIWANGHLHRVNAKTGNTQQIPFKAQVRQELLETRRTSHPIDPDQLDLKVVRWPQVTPDGKTAVFQALGHLYRRDLASGTVERITQQDVELEFAPRLSHDGAQVVYTTWDDENGGFIRSVPVAGGKVTTLVDTPGHYTSASLSRDGKQLVYHRGGGDTYRGHRFSEQPGIYRVQLGRDTKPRFVRRGGRDPQFSADARRIYLRSREGKKAALISVDRIGSDRRVHVTSERAADFELSPDGRWLAFEHLWQTYVTPLPPGPGPFDVSPNHKSVPVRRLSGDSGTYLSWSPDSKIVRWSLGQDLFEAEVAELFAQRDAKEPKDGDTKPRGVGAEPVRIGFSVPIDRPATDVWFVGARVLPMHDESVIEDGVVHVRGNRIVAVGTRAEVEVPEGAKVYDVSGKTLLPGLIDAHSHTGSSNAGMQAEQNWSFLALLSFGVTTVHDPSNNSQGIYAESELVRTGHRVGPRVFSTGTILYGAEGDFKAVVNSYEDALQEVKRTTAWGPFSVKSYNQPRRDQRQQIMKAARELGVLVMPEGGSTYHYNLTHILDGHTTLEHAIPIAPLYDPELRLLAGSGTCYTPTLVVGYGGLWGENYWYARTKVWANERLLRFVPRSIVDPRARRRTVATDEEEYHHLRLAATAAEVYRRGGPVEIGAHGQLQGLGSHWETWMLEQGGLTPHQALRCATYCGAQAVCLEDQLGSIRPGMLADLIVVEGDVLANVRDSEKVLYTMTNGRLYEAATLTQLEPERVELPPGPPLDSVRGGGSTSHCLCGR